MFVSFLALSSLICLSSGNDPMKGGITSPTPNACPTPEGNGAYPSAQSCNAFILCWGDSQSGYEAAKFTCGDCNPTNSCCNNLLCYYPPDAVYEYGHCDDCNRDCTTTCPEGPDPSAVDRNTTLPDSISTIVTNIIIPQRT